MSLPDEALLLIFAELSPTTLGRLSAIDVALSTWLLSSAAAWLWQVHCKRAGLQFENRDPRAVYAHYATTLCKDCSRPCRYTFTLLNRRLCEECERCSPQKYALATELQLVHERSAVTHLSGEQRTILLSTLPSIERGDATWYLRAQVVAAAANFLSPGSEIDKAPTQIPTGESDIGATDHVDDDEGGGESSDVDISAEWECASLEHKESRRRGAEEKAAQREARKAHKRKVKAAARAQRECDPPLPASFRSPRGAGAGSSHKPKRASAREHRMVAEPDAWERQYAELESLFGPMLSGLSGLSLAADPAQPP